jgi:uncharacterized membrane protein
MLGLPWLIVVVGQIIYLWTGRRLSKITDLPVDTTPNECWKWGRYYYNPADLSLLVEGRFGWPYSLNYAHWQSWMISGVGKVAWIAVAFLAIRDFGSF